MHGGAVRNGVDPDGVNDAAEDVPPCPAPFGVRHSSPVSNGADDSRMASMTAGVRMSGVTGAPM